MAAAGNMKGGRHATLLLPPSPIQCDQIVQKENVTMFSNYFRFNLIFAIFLTYFVKMLMIIIGNFSLHKIAESLKIIFKK